MAARSLLTVAVGAYFAIAAIGAANRLQGGAGRGFEQQCHDGARSIPGVQGEAADGGESQGGLDVHAVKAASAHARGA